MCPSSGCRPKLEIIPEYYARHSSNHSGRYVSRDTYVDWSHVSSRIGSPLFRLIDKEMERRIMARQQKCSCIEKGESVTIKRPPYLSHDFQRLDDERALASIN